MLLYTGWAKNAHFQYSVWCKRSCVWVLSYAFSWHIEEKHFGLSWIISSICCIKNVPFLVDPVLNHLLFAIAVRFQWRFSPCHVLFGNGCVIHFIQFCSDYTHRHAHTQPVKLLLRFKCGDKKTCLTSHGPVQFGTWVKLSIEYNFLRHEVWQLKFCCS